MTLPPRVDRSLHEHNKHETMWHDLMMMIDRRRMAGQSSSPHERGMLAAANLFLSQHLRGGTARRSAMLTQLLFSGTTATTGGASPTAIATSFRCPMRRRPWFSFIHQLLLIATTAAMLLGAPQPVAADGNTVLGDLSSRTLCGELSTYAQVRASCWPPLSRRHNRNSAAGNNEWIAIIRQHMHPEACMDASFSASNASL